MTAAPDEPQFPALLAEHGSRLRKVTATYGISAEDREDLHQEILVQLWRSFPSWDPERPFSTWMYRVALNVAISHVRRVTRERRLVRAAAAPLDPPDARSQTATDDARADFLQRVLHDLDELERALLLLHLEDRSYAEIGEVLGITESNVGTKLNRLRTRLRALAPRKNNDD